MMHNITENRKKGLNRKDRNMESKSAMKEGN